MKQISGITLALILFIIAGCKKDAVLPPPSGYNHYFPAEVGNWYEYACDSIIYNDFTGEVDTFKFRIKEVYESVFTDNAGREAIRLERWKLEHDSAGWYLKDVWMLVKTSHQVEKVEEDQRLVKLVFPVAEGREWNLNALNAQSARAVTYSNVHQPYSVSGNNFDSTVTVETTEAANLVNEYRDVEVFAANVGMIFKHYKNVRFYIPGPAIRSGVDFKMYLTNWKK